MRLLVLSSLNLNRVESVCTVFKVQTFIFWGVQNLHVAHQHTERCAFPPNAENFERVRTFPLPLCECSLQEKNVFIASTEKSFISMYWQKKSLKFGKLSFAFSFPPSSLSLKHFSAIFYFGNARAEAAAAKKKVVVWENKNQYRQTCWKSLWKNCKDASRKFAEFSASIEKA